MAHQRASLRDLRMTSASSLLSTPGGAGSRYGSSLRPSASRVTRVASSTDSDVKAYLSVPKRTLNLASGRRGPAASLQQGALRKQPVTNSNSSSSSKEAPRETRRVRKKREWLERREKWRSTRQHGNNNSDNGYYKQGNTQWSYLPDLVLEEIFKMLPFENRLSAALTCKQWLRALLFSSIWSSYVVTDSSMTKTKYNFASKIFENVLDTVRASNALNRLAPKLRHIAFYPGKNLYNTCSFQRMITRYCHLYGDLPLLQSFSYKFPCDFARKSNEMDIYGTGGMILQEMKDLLIHLPGLKKLALIDLELDGHDAAHVLDEVSTVCSYKISDLVLINTSRQPLSLLAITTFVNLRCLTISPHNLGDDLVECIGDMPRLRNITIITNKYTECTPTPVDYRVWKQCRRAHPKLRVHLVTEGKHTKELTFQTRAPVKSIVYETPYTRASAFAINLAVEMYATDLECYAHRMLPRFHMPKRFDDRPDSSYLYLVRSCPYIHTLMIRERISSSTVLLLAYSGKNLRYFHVRRNAIILRCEWPKNPEWSSDFYHWLRKNSRTYEDMEREVSQILGFRWYALNDKQFKLTPLNLSIPYYYEGYEENDIVEFEEPVVVSERRKAPVADTWI